ncbi:MAG: hypothetical protein KDB22_16925, partial [Planctomycetales bacterium]|nr:hypothetical protein [Planctomycetales bacterium]
LLSDGRWLLTQCPKRLASVLDDWFSGGMRAGLLQSQFSPQWYWELQVIGQSDREAGKAAMSLESQLRSMPQQIEAWFATEPPHASWRAIALRYPRMLELFGNYARFGVEDGVAIGNGYLPPEAASNLLFASWLALQPGATEMESSGRIPQANQPLTIDQFLARPIVVSFDQQPIEVALQMVAEEANSSLPTGTPKIDFRLDGSAFELAGITRNQQLKSFNMRNKSVRDALTEIARLGNPVPNVAELSSTEQKLIWVTTQDEDSKATIILLTTRQAAQAAEMTIPAEFSDSL